MFDFAVLVEIYNKYCNLYDEFYYLVEKIIIFI